MLRLLTLFLLSSTCFAVDFYSIFENPKVSTVEAVDLDGDGDLDILLRREGQSNSHVAYYNLGNRQFTPLGHSIHYTTGTSKISGFGRLAPDGSLTLITKNQYPWGSNTHWFESRTHFDNAGLIQVNQEEDPSYQETSLPAFYFDFDGDGLLEQFCEGGNSPFLMKLANGTTIDLHTSLGLPGDGGEFALATVGSQPDMDGNGLPDLVFNAFGALYLSRQSSAGTFSQGEFLGRFEGGKFYDLDGDGDLDWCKISDYQVTELDYALFEQSGLGDLRSNSPVEDAERLLEIVPQSDKPASLIYLKKTLVDDHNQWSLIRVGFLQDQATPLDVPKELEDLLQYAQGDTQMSAQDIDQDGLFDLVFRVSHSDLVPSERYQFDFSSFDVEEFWIGWGKADGLFDWQALNSSRLDPSSRQQADIDGDGDLDLIYFDSGQANWVWLVNSGEGQFEYQGHIGGLNIEAPEGWNLIPLALKPCDHNRDGIADFAIQFLFIDDFRLRYPYLGSSGSEPRHYWQIAEGDGHGNLELLRDLPDGFLNGTESHDWHLLGINDWDGDGDLDAITGDVGWVSNDDGAFSLSSTLLLETAAHWDALGNVRRSGNKIQLADLDGDNDLDLVISAVDRPNPYEQPEFSYALPDPMIGVVLNDGLGGIEALTRLDHSTISLDVLGNPSFSAIECFDLNRDGNADIIFLNPTGADLVGNPKAEVRCILNSSDGKFNSPVSISLAPWLSYMGLNDLDGDEELELGNWQRFVKADSSQLTPQTLQDDQLPEPSTAIVSDLDGDFDADFIISTRVLGHISGHLFYRNSIVDSTHPVTQAALDAGLRGQQTDIHADPDSDGITNQLELLFGGDLTAFDATEAILPSISSIRGSHGGPELRAVFRRNRNLHAGARCVVQMSHDLDSWESLSEEIQTTTPLSGGWEEVEVLITEEDFDSPADQGYIRWNTEPNLRP